VINCNRPGAKWRLETGIARAVYGIGNRNAELRSAPASAQRVFDTLLRFARTGQGDIKQLKGRLAGKLRLRSGDYRLIISQSGDSPRIHSVRHRSEAYR
jgi:mRNA-degrading endonuclease RelE of RelBE toxin-antitoxin system